MSTQTFRTNLILATCAVVLGVTFNYLFFEHIPGISFFLFIVFGLLILYALHWYFGRSYRPLGILTALILFFSLMVAVRASQLLTFLNIVLVFYLLLLLAREATGKRFFKNYVIKDYIIVGLAPIRHFTINCLRILGDLLSLQGAIGNREKTSQAIKGLIMAIPILLLFLVLFASADLVFHKFLNDLVHLDLPPQFIAQMVLMAFVALGSLGALAYVFKRPVEQDDSSPAATSSPSRIGVVQASVFLGAIDALFLFFLLFQLKYLFGGQYNIVQQGFTYAEYAHRGFIELILVALISLVLILTTEHSVDRQGDTHRTPFKAVSLLLMAEVIVIMASAFKRLNIYQDAYAFTVLRFYVSSFIVWLSALFLVFGYKVFKNKKDQFFAATILVAVIVFVGVMDIVNPEGIIVNQNIKHFDRTGKIDAIYLNYLSEDATSAELLLIDRLQGQDKAELVHGLYVEWQRLEQHKGIWQEAHLARSRALKALRSKADTLNRYQEFDAAY